MAELEDLPPTTYPDGSVIGDFDAGNNPPEDPEILHRPHAFALMHGNKGAKVAYGELHWRVDTFKLQFKTSVIAVADHPDHAHEHDHTHTTTSISDATTNAADGSFSGYGETQTQSTSTSGAANPENTSGDADGGSGYYSPDGHIHPHAHTHTIGHTHEVEIRHTHEHPHTHATGSPNEATTSGVKDTDGSTASSAVLSHTVSGQITYCSGASQEAIGNITQQVPKYPTEDGTAMDPEINDTKYHELGEYGDVYLCWKVDLENVGGEVEKCWVQVGDPAGDGINEVPMGNETTDRRAAGDPKVGTGQPEGDDEGVFKIKLGTVNENDPVIQKVSSDVVWTPTVMDRIKI
tara:strand:- start:5288 stop:6334 length:1047 start_codon:yes stop_codon:yes gene_type:complete